MSIASQLFGEDQQLGRQASISRTGPAEKVWLCVEVIWVVMTFMLFLVMGPFAAIAVVPAVISLARQQGDAPMPDPVETRS